MSEPLAEWVQQRLAVTQAVAKLPRRADMPVIATTEISIDLKTGARHIHTSGASASSASSTQRRPVIRRPEPTAVCPVCRKEFSPKGDPGRPRTYCTKACSQVACEVMKAARRLPVKRPLDVREESAVAISAVCSVFKVGRDSIATPTRGNRYATTPRLMAYALVKELRPEASTNDIGRAFGRDHSSVLSGIGAHKRRMRRGSYSLKWNEALALCRQQVTAP